MKKFLISLVCLFLVFEVVYNSETAKNALTNAAASCFDIPLKPGVFDFASASPELYIAHAGALSTGSAIPTAAKSSRTPCVAATAISSWICR